LAREKSSQFVGECEAILKIKETLHRLGKKPQTSVLILGESGTGKEVVARELHQQTHGPASFAKVPFVALNCSAIPPDLLESELYGHEKGAFSGALSSKMGLAEAARDGTLFLDEIGDMDVRHQAKLLRLIQEKTFRRVGATSELAFHGRIVAATHRDLLARANEGLFREDLYYRLSVIHLTLPPLRERGSDVLLLAESICFKHGLSGLAPERIAELLAYAWPGNIRELNNWIERASILGGHDDAGLMTDLLPSNSSHASQSGVAPIALVGDLKQMREKMLEDLDRRAIQAALLSSDYNISIAAKKLGIDRKNLGRRIKELDLDAGESQGPLLTRRRKNAA
jgi:transcriptional regulator with PAS, ATPase and Fis domain